MKSADLKLEYWAIKRPKPHPKNARSHPPEQVRQLVASIKEFGFTKPIVCDEKNEILAGHGAYQAALQLGLEKVPVVVRTGLSQAQKRAYRIADNKLGEKSVWEDSLLAGEFAALKDAGYDLSLTGWG